ncbi:MAG: hypothetical protein BWK76_04135 [Desulfobulbaceae bacterium A2]|nr:MAG: hypothetical protein BWK76_04135 [Desulfobulbaceae bacterium A2]
MRTFLSYDQQLAILTWTVPLLEKMKQRKQFFELLRESGKLALEFLRLSRVMLVANLRLDSVQDGPVLHCA